MKRIKAFRNKQNVVSYHSSYIVSSIKTINYSFTNEGGALNFKDMTLSTSPAFRVYSFIIPASDILNQTGSGFSSGMTTINEIDIPFGSGATYSQVLIFGSTNSVFLKNTSNTTISGFNSLDTTGLTANFNAYPPPYYIGTEDWNSFPFYHYTPEQTYNCNLFTWDGSSNIQVFISTYGTQSIDPHLGMSVGTSSGHYWAYGQSATYPITAAPGLTGTDQVQYTLHLND